MAVTKIGASLLGTISSDRSLGGGRLVTRESGSESSLRSDATEVALGEDSARAPKASASGVSAYLSVRDNAVSSIANLRSQQAELASKATTLALGQEREDLQTQMREIETEITRIAGSATYKGTNVLQGATFGENDSDDGVESSIFSVENISSLTQSQNFNVQTVSGALSAESTLDYLVSQGSTAVSSTRSAQGVAEATVPSATSAESADSADRLSVEEAEALARRISDEFTRASNAQFTSADTTVQLISALSDGLDPDTVSALTSD